MAHRKTTRQVKKKTQRKTDDKIRLNGGDVPEWYLQLEPEVLKLLALKDEVEHRIRELHTTIHTMMVTDDVHSIKTDLTSATRVKPSEGRKFETDRFKEDNPGLYLEYSKPFSRSGSVSLKLIPPPK